MRIFRTQRNHAQVVAHEFNCVVIGGKCREGREDRRVLRVFNVHFEREVAFTLGELEQRELEAEQFEVGGFAVARAAKQRAENAQCTFQNSGRIANHECACSGAQNDDEFKGLI